ncbi:MAG: glycosyltransferase [Bacteroidales bacterium]|nr:glycosyltransferase [Bacteroidales bacterium]
MKESPSVSVIVPVYNAEKYIRRCCESIFSQTYENLEVVIVNDGSTDTSIDIVREILDEEFSHMKSKVRIIDQENQGSPVARRTGIVSATGEYIIQFDSDDWVSERMIEKMVDAAVREEADVVICKYYNVYKSWIIPRREKRFPDSISMLDSLFSHRHFRAYLWNKLARRELFTKKDFLFPRYPMCEDMVITAQLLLNADKIVYINDRLYYYRKTNTASISKESRTKRDKDVLLNKIDLWDFLEKGGNNPLDPIRENYLLQLGWIAYDCNHYELLDSRPDLLDAIKAIPLNPKYSLPLKDQVRLKERMRAYEEYRETGDEALIPRFQVNIKERH